MSSYKLPFFQKAGVKLHVIVLYVIMFIGSSLFASSYFFVGIQQRPIVDTIFAIFFAAIAIYLIYVLSGLLLKRFYIELTPTIVNINVPFKNILLTWDEIAFVKLHRKYSRTYLAILLKEDVGRDFSYLVPLTYFTDIDVDSLVNTFKRNIKKTKKVK